eukprot:2891271-Pyramimonas_sp.AAC.1
MQQPWDSYALCQIQRFHVTARFTRDTPVMRRGRGSLATNTTRATCRGIVRTCAAFLRRGPSRSILDHFAKTTAHETEHNTGNGRSSDGQMRAPRRAHDQSDGCVEFARAGSLFNLGNITAITCLIGSWTSAPSACLPSFAP